MTAIMVTMLMVVAMMVMKMLMVISVKFAFVTGLRQCRWARPVLVAQHETLANIPCSNYPCSIQVTNFPRKKLYTIPIQPYKLTRWSPGVA